jgi:hypothetical protein
VIAVEPPSIVVAAIMGGMSDVPLWERSSTDREHFRGTFDADADACDRGWPVCPASVFDDVVELANLGPPAVDTLGPWNRTPRHGVVGMTPIVSGWKGTEMETIVRRIGRFCGSVVRQLPHGGYPSDHPWSVRHDSGRPRG